MTAVGQSSPQIQAQQEEQAAANAAPKNPGKKGTKSAKGKVSKVKKLQVPSSHPPYNQVNLLYKIPFLKKFDHF